MSTPGRSRKGSVAPQEQIQTVPDHARRLDACREDGAGARDKLGARLAEGANYTRFRKQAVDRGWQVTTRKLTLEHGRALMSEEDEELDTVSRWSMKSVEYLSAKPKWI